MANGTKEEAGHPQELHGLPSIALPSLQQQELDEFWRKTTEDIENTVNFNNYILPMSCVAQVIRDNQGSFMMSSDTPQFLTKLLEIFIQELTVRAWMCAKSNDRSTILDSDIYEAVNSGESFASLNDALLQRYEANHDQVSMFSNAPHMQQESQFLATTSTLTENVSTDPLIKSAEKAFQIPEDKLVPATFTQPDPLELKNQEDLENMSTTSGGRIEETK